MKRYRCRLCGFVGDATMIHRHNALIHNRVRDSTGRAGDRPTCAVCPEPASVWATVSKIRKTARCRKHAHRFGICMWCFRPLSAGWGHSTFLCKCATDGTLNKPLTVEAQGEVPA